MAGNSTAARAVGRQPSIAVNDGYLKSMKTRTRVTSGRWIRLEWRLGVLMAALSLLSNGETVEQSSLRPLWRTAVHTAGNPPIGTPATVGGLLFLVRSGVEAYSAATGELLWTVPLSTYVPQDLVASAGMVFVPEKTVFALDARTGKRKWEFSPDANASLGRAATDGKRLYFGTASHRLYALRVSDGRELWATNLGPEWQDPAVIRGVTIWKDKGYATVEQWTAPNGHSVSGWLIAFRASDGKILWRYRTGQGAQRQGLSSSPTVTEDLVVSADYLSNAVVAVRRNNGHEAWRFQGDSGFVGFPEAPIVYDQTVFMGSGDTHVYALELKSGHLLWRTKLPAASGSYALCGNNLLVNYGALAVLKLDSGMINQTLLKDPGELVTSDLAVTGHEAYVAGPNAVYAFACR